MSDPKTALLLRDFTHDMVLAGRLWRKIGRQAASRHGVTEAASSPLIWIDRLGDHVRQNVLAEAVGIEGASLVRLIDELEGNGFVRRETDPTDRRANVVSLTEKGRNIVTAVHDELQALRMQIFANLCVEDLEAAQRVFDAVKGAAGREAPV